MIKTDRDKYISLSFIFLDIQVSERGDCWKDFVEIRDGADGSSPSLGIIWKFLAEQVLDVMHKYADIISRLLCMFMTDLFAEEMSESTIRALILRN